MNAAPVALSIGGRPLDPLGTFGKGVTGSVHLSLAPSGGRYCDTGCALHPESTSPHAAPVAARCYAVRVERFRGRLGAKLAAVGAMDPESVASLARGLSAARGHRFPWFRVSAFGGVPSPDAVPSLAGLLRDLDAAGTPVHFPTESPGKRDRWRDALDGSGVVVRLSIAPGDPAWGTDPLPASTVAVGSGDHLDAARDAAAARRVATGRRCIVCPAVASGILATRRHRAAGGRGRAAGSPRAKCGTCRACADPGVDVVYPLHR